ncbi:hypothetical protein JHK82_027373 [Glycine max]|uniref:Uncharacterized protein n=2 Tax=Glycine subgen. Soja TaxID=1462606 RepID=A0A0R0HZY1_SOYBN|nr:hypothetical protein JHK87_027274 [Glycine soja]KAG4996580.1 hypothetical protein JHK85_028019 [Glycine max]KAG5003359.1 hypothetical protein JHK86_027498 [Glycine max]KAG5126538.1 hypothetical protein JHK82_027373 [Glycine max]KAG5151144.1 hypothetical protein JHK84_027616 [Glycine max]
MVQCCLSLTYSTNQTWKMIKAYLLRSVHSTIIHTLKVHTELHLFYVQEMVINMNPTVSHNSSNKLTGVELHDKLRVSNPFSLIHSP